MCAQGVGLSDISESEPGCAAVLGVHCLSAWFLPLPGLLGGKNGDENIFVESRLDLSNSLTAFPDFHPLNIFLPLNPHTKGPPGAPRSVPRRPYPPRGAPKGFFF